MSGSTKFGKFNTRRMSLGLNSNCFTFPSVRLPWRSTAVTNWLFAHINFKKERDKHWIAATLKFTFAGFPGPEWQPGQRKLWCSGFSALRPSCSTPCTRPGWSKRAAGPRRQPESSQSLSCCLDFLFLPFQICSSSHWANLGRPVTANINSSSGGCFKFFCSLLSVVAYKSFLGNTQWLL